MGEFLKKLCYSVGEGVKNENMALSTELPFRAPATRQSEFALKKG